MGSVLFTLPILPRQNLPLRTTAHAQDNRDASSTQRRRSLSKSTSTTLLKRNSSRSNCDVLIYCEPASDRGLWLTQLWSWVRW